ncbi:MAG: nucleoside monophosphate kinase [Phycisphaerales bacterium]|nr:nucleoside monophosphate kinase [Hyphomonadaceae bacterium]
MTTNPGDSDADNLQRIQADHAIEESVKAEIRALCVNAAAPISIICIDIDKIAVIRAAGIASKLHVLKQLAARVQNAIPDAAHFYDIGTRDEFVVVLREATDATTADTAETVRAAISKSPVHTPDGAEHTLTASLGTGIWPVDAVDPEFVYALAKGASAAAKEAGRNTVVAATPCNGLAQLSFDAPRQRMDSLRATSANLMRPMSTLVLDAIDLACQRHAGLEQFHKGLEFALSRHLRQHTGLGSTIIVSGPPGSGKSSLANQLRSKRRSRVFAVRPQLNHLRSAGAELAAEIDAILATEKFIPDALVGKMLSAYLHETLASDDIILEGVPISRGQAFVVEKALINSQRTIDLIVFLNADPDTVRRRVEARRICLDCEATTQAGRSYSDGETTCPDCGKPLTRRRDDEMQHLERRLAQYQAERSLVSAALGHYPTLELNSESLSTVEIATIVLGAIDRDTDEHP